MARHLGVSESRTAVGTGEQLDVDAGRKDRWRVSQAGGTGQ